MLWSLDIIELAGLCRPDEDEPCGKADEEHENDECDDCPEHENQPFYLSLSEFITTVTELIAMAAAATIGLTTPAMASGIAATL